MGTRFNDLIKQKNQEQLEKMLEYYTDPAHKDENPAMLASIMHSLDGTAKHNLVVYGATYFINLPEMEQQITAPIFNGIDLDDLLYFFDPGYSIECIEHMPRHDIDGQGFGIPDTTPVLLALYAKYAVLTSKGNESAHEFEIQALDAAISEELKRPKLYDGKTALELCNSIDVQTDKITETALYKAIKNAYSVLFPTSYELAQRQGALFRIGVKEVSITDEDFQYALTPLKNDTAYILPLAEPLEKEIKVSNGYVYIQYEQLNNMEKESIEKLDIPLLRRFFSAVYKSYVDIDNYTTTVYFPTFLREAGLHPVWSSDPEKQKSIKTSDILQKMEPFKNCLGVLYNEKFLKVYDVIAIDQKAQTITFATPYMNQVILNISNNPNRNIYNKKGDKFLYQTPAYSELIHADIVKVRNKTAVEILEVFISILERRGTVPDIKTYNKKNAIDESIISISIRVSEIINRVPLLKNRYESAKGTANKNKVLKTAFSAAYELIDTHTDVGKVYKNFSISKLTPTCTTINQKIELSHYGKAPTN